MELVAYGAQDVYLTGNPQITFFKVVYRRHTNFSMETIQQSASGNSLINDSENEASFTIARNGDLIHKIYLTTDKLTNNGIEFGSKSIKEIEISIGGQMIDRYTQEWQDIWNELSTPKCKALGVKAMIGDIGFSNCNSTTDTDKMDHKGVNFIQIPLLFWFCRNPGLALPLIALQYHEVKIDIKFNKLSDIVDTVTITEDIEYSLYVDYIYLDTDERRRFAQVSHEYLIEQLQIVKASDSTIQELSINHPVKELIWTSSRLDNLSYGSAKLVLNGQERFSKQKEEYFQLRQPYDYHTSIPHQNLPRAGIHNVNLISHETIFNGELTSIKRDDNSSSLGNALDNVLGNFQGTLKNLNNNFDFNSEIGSSSNSFLYFPTYFLRADHNTTPHLFLPPINSEGGNATYPTPGHFVNDKILDESDFNLLNHTFLPRDIRFLNFNAQTRTVADSSPFLGRLNYNVDDSDNLLNNPSTNSGRIVIDEFGFNPNGTEKLIIHNIVPNNAITFGLDGLQTDELEPKLWNNSEEFLVLVIKNSIADKLKEGNTYEFEVENVDEGFNTPVINTIFAGVKKIIKGNTITTFADDAARVAGFSCLPNNSPPDASNQNEDIFALTTSAPVGDTIADAMADGIPDVIGPRFAVKNRFTDIADNTIPARGIVLAGATDVDQVSFIYLDANINPLLASNEFSVGGYNEKYSFTDIGFLNAHNITRTQQKDDEHGSQKPFDIPKFKIKKILHSTDTNSKKGHSSTSHMTKKINVYSFALKPEEHQPSGTCNFSRIDTTQLITDNAIGNIHNIYAVNYNVLRIMSGMGGLAYSN